MGEEPLNPKERETFVHTTTAAVNTPTQAFEQNLQRERENDRDRERENERDRDRGREIKRERWKERID